MRTVLGVPLIAVVLMAMSASTADAAFCARPGTRCKPVCCPEYTCAGNRSAP